MTASLDDPELRKTRQALCLMFQFCGMAFVDFAHLKRRMSGVGFWNINARKRVDSDAYRGTIYRMGVAEGTVK